MSHAAIKRELVRMSNRQISDEESIKELRSLVSPDMGTLGDRILDHCDKRHCDKSELNQLITLVARDASKVED